MHSAVPYEVLNFLFLVRKSVLVNPDNALQDLQSLIILLTNIHYTYRTTLRLGSTLNFHYLLLCYSFEIDIL